MRPYLILILMTCCLVHVVATEADKPAHVFRFRLLDQAGKPVEDVTVSVSVSYVFLNDAPWREMVSDENGRCSFELSEREMNYPFCTVRLNKKGFASGFYYIYPKKDSEPPSWEHTLVMEGLRTIGGTVVDENGKPVEKVRIHTARNKDDDGKKDKDASQVRSGCTSSFNEEAVTDENGRWTLGGVPEKSFWPYNVIAEADGYLQACIRIKDEDSPEAKDALHGNLKLELSPSLTVKGRFQDNADRSLDGVRLEVTGGWCRCPTHVFENGDFTVKGLTTGKYGFLTLSPNHAPQFQEIDISADTPEIVVPLEAGKTIRFRFVDPAGKPIPEAAFRSGYWIIGEERKVHFSLHHFDRTKLQADTEGQFFWPHAPEGRICYTFFARGFQHLSTPPLEPGEKVHTITMRPVVKVRGTITDAETGKPIPWAFVRVEIPESVLCDSTIPILDEKGSEKWQSSFDAKEFLDGTFELDASIHSDRYRIVISTIDHGELISDEFSSVECGNPFRFEMKRKPPDSKLP